MYTLRKKGHNVHKSDMNQKVSHNLHTHDLTHKRWIITYICVTGHTKVSHNVHKSDMTQKMSDSVKDPKKLKGSQSTLKTWGGKRIIMYKCKFLHNNWSILSVFLWPLDWPLTCLIYIHLQKHQQSQRLEESKTSRLQPGKVYEVQVYIGDIFIYKH